MKNRFLVLSWLVAIVVLTGVIHSSAAEKVIAWGTEWGWSNAVIVPGDYDGDGQSDLAVYDEKTGYWYIRSMDGRILTWKNKWGGPGFVPVPGDYDKATKAWYEILRFEGGIGNRSDLAVVEKATGKWYIKELDFTCNISISPTEANVSTDGGKTSFTVIGGVAPFNWRAQDITLGTLGQMSPSTNRSTVYVRYHSGDNFVRVVDRYGNTSASVIIKQPSP